MAGNWDYRQLKFEAAVEELRTNCDIALRAWTELRGTAPVAPIAIAGTSDSEMERHTHEVWRHVYSILDACGRISRVLWNSPDSERLRTGFDVTDDSPLRARQVRNALEHLEQRISAFIDSHPHTMVGGWRVSNMPNPPSRPEAAFLRHLDAFNWKLRVFDPPGYCECDLEGLMRAIRALEQTLPHTIMQVNAYLVESAD